MIDCSRNGVLKPEAVYFFLRNMALMGLNMLQLYTEDTFEVENEPFFGYLRGKYTSKELAAIDDYAYDLYVILYNLSHNTKRAHYEFIL
jgi:hypothetical protein